MKFILYVFADLIALASIIVQTTDIKYGDFDKNSFFHVGVAIYVFFNTIAFMIVNKENKENKGKNLK